MRVQWREERKGKKEKEREKERKGRQKEDIGERGEMARGGKEEGAAGKEGEGKEGQIREGGRRKEREVCVCSVFYTFPPPYREDAMFLGRNCLRQIS